MLMPDVDRCRDAASLLATASLPEARVTRGFLQHWLRLVNGTKAAGVPLLATDPPARFLSGSSARQRGRRPDPTSCNRYYRTWMRAAHSRRRERGSYPARGQ